MAARGTSKPQDKPQPSAEQAERSAESDAAEVQEKVNAETEQGFRGVEVDPTPNENYTLAGQNAGLPTPETDEDTAEKARLAAVEVARQSNGVAQR